MTSNLSKPYLLDPSTPPGLIRYAHARTIQTGGYTTMYISGIASVTPEGNIEGLVTQDDGSARPDIKAQTRAVLSRIEAIIQGASDGKADMKNIVDATVYLLDMERDYKGFNEVWNGVYKSREEAPSRATIEVKGLPDKRLIVEVKAVAVF
ncbi:Endoribonuclease L-PSP/chorismate mutase-like protein [Aspergillus venezuelensis]